MLQSFKEQLRQRAVDPNDPFHKHLRRRIGKKATLLLEKRLKQMILMMPGMISRVYDFWRQPESSARVKKIGGFLITYMYHPKDFIPEQDFGLFGYLDDAYFVSLVYEETLRDMKQRGAVISLQDREFLAQIQKIKKSVRMVIALEALQIETMLKEVLDESVESYIRLFEGSQAA